MAKVFQEIKNYGSLDYVASWYYKAACYVQSTHIKVAFVSTNSITQGEQASILWEALFAKGIQILFAHRTFRWDSEATKKAAVHCVIVGFSVHGDNSPKLIFQGKQVKGDYRYTGKIVYNNFPWPTPTDAQRMRIEQTAQAILDARALYPDCSLADLYDETTMPPELRKAHQQNDKAVMQAYGFWGKLNSEPACVAELMRMYQELTEQGSNSQSRKRGDKRCTF